MHSWGGWQPFLPSPGELGWALTDLHTHSCPRDDGNVPICPQICSGLWERGEGQRDKKKWHSQGPRCLEAGLNAGHFT